MNARSLALGAPAAGRRRRGWSFADGRSALGLDRRWTLAVLCALGLLQAAWTQPAAPPEPTSPPAAEEATDETNQPPAIVEEEAPGPEARAEAGPDGVEEPMPAAADEPAPAAAEDRGAAAPAPADAGRTPERSAETGRAQTPKPAATAPSEPAATPLGEDEKGLRLNFRGVPLELVLDYLSDAAGFIINLETEVRGKVDVWSNHPLTKDEAVSLLNTVLNKNGYAALRNGRTLTILSREEAKKRDIPVRSASSPDEIPKTDEIVTQIIPVRYISATQLVKDLQVLLPSTATLTANEGGNALVLTDTQANIHRMAEIVKALDTAIASVSVVKVFPLRYADAKTLATTIQNLFQTQDTGRNTQGGPGQRFFNMMRQAQGGDAGAGAAANGGRAPQPRVVAVADERSNSVVVSAPEEQMAVIDGVVEEIDRPVEDITELRVFRLRHADPQETADLLNELFEETTGTQNNGSPRTGQVRFFGGGRFPGGPAGANAAAAQSERMLKQTRVVAVPDLRTRSVVVSASKDLMEQIASMLDQLDADPARKQKVFVYSVENTDPQAVQEVLQSLFPEPNYGTGGSSRNTRTTTQRQNNQLNTRATQTQNQGLRSGTGTTFGGNTFGSAGTANRR